MNREFKAGLTSIVQDDTDELIQYWLNFFEDEKKDDQYRYYDDFLGFFEECLESDLNPISDEAQALILFLQKIQAIIGDDEFFHFNSSTYTTLLKKPLLKLLQDKDLFSYENSILITNFFDGITSQIIAKHLKQSKNRQSTTIQELQERETPISEIWEGVLIVSLVGTLDSNRAMLISDKVLHYLEHGRYDHIIVDISAINDMNTEVANQISKLHRSIHFMGATPHVVGVTANIAKSLARLNLNLGDVKTYTTTKHAMQVILADH